MNSSELYQIMLDLTRDKHGRTSIKNIRPIKKNKLVSYPYWSPMTIENQNTNEIEEFPYELKDYDSRLNAIRRANELIKKNRHKLRKQGKYDELEKPIPEFCLEVIMDYGDTEPGRSIDKKAIDNEELFKLKDDDDFIPRLNRTMYEYLISKKESAQAEDRWDEKNILYTPYRNFGDWFDKHPEYSDAESYFEEIADCDIGVSIESEHRNAVQMVKKSTKPKPPHKPKPPTPPYGEDYDSNWECALDIRKKIVTGAGFSKDMQIYDGYRWAVENCTVKGKPISSWLKLKNGYENGKMKTKTDIIIAKFEEDYYD